MRAITVIEGGVNILDVEIPNQKKMKFLLKYLLVV